MGLGTAYDNKLLDAVFGATHGSGIASTMWVALYTAAPSAGGGGTEVAGNGYARVSVPNDASHWPAASSGTKTNGLAITFNEATASWGTITHYGIHDHITNDSLVGFGSLTTPRAVATAETPQFGVGVLGITAS